tara:strand:- start:22286 stop:24871 length:2586 start_codon:yes stop_codon:yes gene_type:complete
MTKAGILGALSWQVVLVAKGKHLLSTASVAVLVMMLMLVGSCQDSTPTPTAKPEVVKQSEFPVSRIAATTAPALEPAVMDIVPSEFEPHSQIVLRAVVGDTNTSKTARFHLLDGSGDRGLVRETDAAGIAVFEAIPAGIYQVWASSGDTVSPLLTVEAYPEDETRDPLMVPLAPGTHLTGRVIAPNGLGVQSTIAIIPTGHDHTIFRSESNAAGEFDVPVLPKGAWEIRATASDYAQSELVRVQATQPIVHTSITLAPKAALSGYVVDESGKPVVGASFRVLDFGNKRLPDAMLLRQNTHGIRWIHPLTGRRQLPIRHTRRFGAERPGVRPSECGNGHCGVDIGGVRGAAVLAAASGTIVVASNDDRGKSGRYVAIEHRSGFKSFYMHLDSVELGLEVGATVAAGAILGTLGRSGIQHSEPHLHFALSKEDSEQPYFVDPEPMLRFAVVLAQPSLATVPSSNPLHATEDSQSTTVANAPAMTDAAGAFSRSNLAAGDYLVTVSHPDLAPGQSAKLTLRPGANLADIRIVLKTGVSFEGRVFGPEGPVADTWIRAYQGQGESRRQLARSGVDANGGFRLRPLLGSIDLEIGAAGFGVIHQTISANEMASGDAVFELSLFDAVLRGQVRSPSGAPLQAAQVQILSGPAGRGRRATSDAYGFFQFDTLPTGTYSLRVRAKNFPEIETSVPTGAEKDLILQQGGALALDVRDGHNNQPQPGLRVQLQGPKGLSTTALSDHQGHVELTGLVPGTWTASIDSIEHTLFQQAFDVAASEATPEPREVRLQRGASLRGVVRDRYGDRVEGARVWVGRTETTSDSDGVFRLNRVPTGDVVLRAKRGDETSASPLGLFAGDEFVTLELTIE